MYQLQTSDRTKTMEKAVYYMENKETLQEFWSRTEIREESVEFEEIEMKVGAFLTLDEVNADIAKKDLSDVEIEMLFRDIPGELG